MLKLLKSVTFLVYLRQYIHFSVSTIRHERFVSIQKSKDLSVLELSQQSDTCWVHKHKGVLTFKQRFAEICEMLKYFAKKGKVKERDEAKGLLFQLKSVNIIFFLYILDESFFKVHSLSLFCKTSRLNIAKLLILLNQPLLPCKNCELMNTFHKHYYAWKKNVKNFALL